MFDSPRRDDYLVFGRPQIGEEEIAEVVATLRSGWLGTGPKVAAFEAEFARYCGIGHALALSSCTAALQLGVQSLDLDPGDEVIVPSLTFVATANAVIHAGALPVLADVDPVTWNLDLADVERRITPRTRAVLAVHFAGRPCDIGRDDEVGRGPSAVGRPACGDLRWGRCVCGTPSRESKAARSKATTAQWRWCPASRLVSPFKVVR